MIEKILNEKGKHIDHNKIHRIMLEEGLAKHEERKQKRRKYKCYQRKHSLSLVHIDWSEYKKEKFILFEEDIDALRFVIEKTDGNKIVIEDPSVQKIKMGGQESWQII